MKKIFCKVIVFLLLVSISMSSFAGCKVEDNTYKGPLLPDYSASDKSFDFFAYRAMVDSSYIIDGVRYYPDEEYADNFLTEKAYQTYKNAGFNMMMVAGVNTYSGEGWVGSACQTSMKMTYATGIDKIIIRDERISNILTNVIDEVIGEGKSFETQEAFENEIKSYLLEYYQEPGFCGYVLGDEPSAVYYETYGLVYKTIKKVAAELGIEDIYLHINFLPITTDVSRFALPGDDGSLTFEELYTRYIENFLIATEADRLSVDIYIFRASGIYPGSYANVQILRELADKYGADLTFCLQSFELWNGKNPNYSKVDKAMMRMELEMMIGMGMDDFAYYTYSPDKTFNTDGNKTIDSSAFLDNNGEPTEIYQFGSEVMAEAKAFEKVVLNYKFKGSNLYTAPVAKFNNTPYITSDMPTSNPTTITYKKGYQFALIKDFSKDFTCDNDVAFITELFDENNDLYMYMVQNCIDPRNGKNGDTTENITVNFGTEYKYIAEFDAGHLTYHNLNNGVYSRTLSAGQAVFIVPLK